MNENENKVFPKLNRFCYFLLWKENIEYIVLMTPDQKEVKYRHSNSLLFFLLSKYRLIDLF